MKSLSLCVHVFSMLVSIHVVFVYKILQFNAIFQYKWANICYSVTMNDAGAGAAADVPVELSKAIDDDTFTHSSAHKSWLKLHIMTDRNPSPIRESIY